MARHYHINNGGTNLTSNTSAGATTSPVNAVPSISTPFYAVFDATNINNKYEVVEITGKTATNINHAPTVYDHTTAEEVRFPFVAEEADMFSAQLNGDAPLAIQAPQGFLINGKISVTDTGSGLNVALKTLAGTDPSSTDPIYVRLNDSVRTISQAISVTMADGTNWFNAGSAELATKEIDYFVYLIWNSANSRVSIAVSRIPYYKNWSEVTDSNTSERNFEYDSNFGSAVANDECEVVGRFAATLSAGAGYTWSVPTFTAENLIQRPIYETRNLSWLPTYSASSSMTWTSVTTTSATYKLTGKVCDIFFRATGTTGGTASTELRFSIPVSTTDTNLTGCGNTGDTAFQGGGATYFVSASVIGVVKQAVGNWGLGASRRCETIMRFPI